MRVVVTRPQADGARTAAALEARGHEVLLAPLLQVERVAANLSGAWSGVIVTSANAPGALDDAAKAALLGLPIYAVGQRSAEAARAAGFTDVACADGDARDLVRLIAQRQIPAKAPLLYLAGEDRAADLVQALAVRGLATELRVVYRAVTLPFPPELEAALEAGDVEAVLHFSRRSAQSYVAGARDAGIADQALAVLHYCLSEQVAEPLRAAGAGKVAVAPRPDEAALIALLSSSAG